jgi:WD40 repeat protein
MSGLSSLRSRPLFVLPALAAALALGQLAPAQGTRLWTQSDLAQFEKGTPQGVELTSDGHLHQGPGLSALLTTPSTFVWSVAIDKAGLIYLGTGSPATILRVDPKAPAKPFTLFETKDLTVQSLRIDPDGALYAATLPSGRVLRLNPAATAKSDDTSATVVFDPAKLPAANKEKKSHYVWDLTFDSNGKLYIATGDPAAIYRVDPTKIDLAHPEEFFKTDEPHVRSLAWDANGNLIAGTDGSGLVYSISPDGHGYVLFQAPRREITSVAVAPDGTIYAASVGDKSRIPLAPLPVQGAVGGMGMVTILQPASLQAANPSSSLPDGSEIWALAENQAPRRLWAAKDEVIYSLLSRPGGLLALAGNRGQIFRIQPDGSYADIAHLDAQQVLSFATAGDALFLGTGNTGKLFSLSAAGEHEYASQVLDAGALARFGHVEVEPGSKGYNLFTRSGNVEQPTRGWTEWQPLKDGVTASPAGRFFQWKAVLSSGASLGSVAVNYLPVNAAPTIDDVIVVPGARLNASAAPGSLPQTVSIAFPAPAASTPVTLPADASAAVPIQAAKDRSAVTARWAAHDDNGDELTYSLYLRGDGESVWRLLKDKLTEKSYAFDATQLPDGGYQLKVIASDAPSHTPADALTAERISPRFELDTTPPAVTGLKAIQARSANSKPAITVTFTAEDASSPIARAEYSLDAGPWQFIEPVGKLSDSRRETYDLSIDLPEAKPQEHLLTVRVYDRHDNAGLAKILVQEK